MKNNKDNLQAAFLAFVILIIVLSLIYDNYNKSQQTVKDKELFLSKCSDYKTYDCSWGLTKTTGFTDYLTLCKSLYGQDKTEYSCLYTYCPLCKQSQGQLDCSQQCTLCQASKSAGLSTESCCANFNANCANTAKCSVC